MIFEQKKIQIETLSEYLSAARVNLNLSAEEVSKKTNISIKFLTALESGNLSALPANVYVYGFLRQLAEIYLVDEIVLIEQYKKEKGISQQLYNAEKNQSSGWQRKYFKKLVVTPKILSFGMGTIFVVASLIYIIWQVWSINKTPKLEIIKPENNSVINSSFVQVVGKTDPGMNITVNDQIIFVDNNGNFQTQVGLSPGPKEIIVVSKNRFDKSFTKTLNITGAVPEATISGLQVKVDFTGTVTLNFIIDDQPEQSLAFNPGDSKMFMATKKIVISTTDAGATKINLNGQNLGPIGRNGEVINNVSFYAQDQANTEIK